MVLNTLAANFQNFYIPKLKLYTPRKLIPYYPSPSLCQPLLYSLFLWILLLYSMYLI